MRIQNKYKNKTGIAEVTLIVTNALRARFGMTLGKQLFCTRNYMSYKRRTFYYKFHV